MPVHAPSPFMFPLSRPSNFSFLFVLGLFCRPPLSLICHFSLSRIAYEPQSSKTRIVTVLPFNPIVRMTWNPSCNEQQQRNWQHSSSCLLSHPGSSPPFELISHLCFYFVRSNLLRHWSQPRDLHQFDYVSPLHLTFTIHQISHNNFAALMFIQQNPVVPTLGFSSLSSRLSVDMRGFY